MDIPWMRPFYGRRCIRRAKSLNCVKNSGNHGTPVKLRRAKSSDSSLATRLVTEIEDENSLFLFVLDEIWRLISQRKVEDEVIAKYIRSLVWMGILSGGSDGVLPGFSWWGFACSPISREYCFQSSLQELQELWSHDIEFENTARFFYTPLVTASHPTEVRPDRYHSKRKCLVAYIMCHRESDIFSMGCMMSGELSGDAEFYPVFSALRFGSNESLLTLLQHGYSTEIGSVNSLLPFEFQEFLLRILRVKDSNMVEVINTNGIRYGAKLMLIVLLWIHEMEDGKIIVSPEPRLASATQEICGNYRLVLRAIREHYVSMRELEFIHHLVENVLGWEETKSLYSTHFPDMLKQETQPRQLKHLSRILIRDNLLKNGHLPEGVWNLPLPRILLRYVNLELN